MVGINLHFPYLFQMFAIIVFSHDAICYSRICFYRTMAEAATVPVAYATAYYALVVKGNLRAVASPS